MFSFTNTKACNMFTNSQQRTSFSVKERPQKTQIAESTEENGTSGVVNADSQKSFDTRLYQKKQDSLFFDFHGTMDSTTGIENLMSKCKHYFQKNPLFYNGSFFEESFNHSFLQDVHAKKMRWFSRAFPDWCIEDCELLEKIENPQKTIVLDYNKNYFTFEDVKMASPKTEENVEKNLLIIIDGNNFFWSKEIFRSLVLRNANVSHHVPFDKSIVNPSKFSNCQSILEKLAFFFSQKMKDDSKKQRIVLFFDGPLCVYNENENEKQKQKYEKIIEKDYFSIKSAQPNFKIADDAIVETVKEHFENLKNNSEISSKNQVVVITSDVGLKKRLKALEETIRIPNSGIEIEIENSVCFMGSVHFLEEVSNWAMKNLMVFEKNTGEMRPLFQSVDDLLTNFDEILY